jgi:hypothetical protein
VHFLQSASKQYTASAQAGRGEMAIAGSH